MGNSLKEKIIYPELSYKLIGLCYDVHNKLGGGLKEKLYENALCVALSKNDIKFKRQVPIAISYGDEKIGQRFLDVLVDDKIVVELKVGDRFKKTNIDQLYEYLVANKLKLGLLVNMGSKEVKYKRILNIV